MSGGASKGACEKRQCLPISYMGASSTASRTARAPAPGISSTRAAVTSGTPETNSSSTSKMITNGRCGSCENCLKLRRNDVCGNCVKCVRKQQGLPSTGACLHRKCLGSLALSTKVHSSEFNSEVLNNDCHVAFQNKVYAKWSDNDVSFSVRDVTLPPRPDFFLI